MSDFMTVLHFLQRNSIIAVVIAFGLIVLWAYWPGNRQSLERQGRIPLDDDR
ncbi:MAG TPA: cbb3-type cytochrome c oxidase subunit 3 [Stellaceae bacterium]|nr:cbb3-type cytochrome c oxidase subunit 3 [Stellaceae bacterium]